MLKSRRHGAKLPRQKVGSGPGTSAETDLDKILDLETYPLDRLDTPRGQELVARCRADLSANGMFNLHDLVRPEALAQCIAEIAPELRANAYEHRQVHNIYFRDEVPGLAPDHPALKRSETVNRKICADQIPGSTLLAIYEWPPLIAFIAKIMGKPVLYPMADPLARLNVMTYRAGEALNWHFDRSEFTTTLLLEAPDSGGEFQYRSDLRTDDDPNHDGVARLLRGQDDRVKSIALSPGSLNVFRGKNTAHRVSPVHGANPRTIAVLSYFESPGVQFTDRDRVRFYGRTG